MHQSTSIGGQAVIEGVMMKGPTSWSVAVRDAKGVIQTRDERLRALHRAWKLPVLRGVVALFHALVIGIKALEFSATVSAEGIEDEKPLTKTAIAGTIAFSIVLSVVLFILVPLWATRLIGMVLEVVDKSSVAFNLVDGVVRVFVFLAYVVGIGLWSEIRRVFEYHGAEHMVIHAFEHGRAMTTGEAMGYSPLHPRCGTSFLMIVMVVSIVVFSAIPQTWPMLYKFLARLVLVPLIAGLSYEALKLSAKLKDNAIVAAMVWPGLMLQRLTTRTPDEAQVEVALVAMQRVLDMEESDTLRPEVQA
jgi:uncharacterized protein YqhQ